MKKTTASAPTHRRTTARAEAKRADILAAARTLFLEGYDRAGTDAIAAAAGVSKRTVYDYFGDKRSIFHHVIADEHAAVLAVVQAAVEEEIVDDLPLEEALTAFARRVLTGAVGSAHYTVLRRLMSTAPADVLPAASGALVEPEQVLADRFADLARQGRLRAPDARRAADHFSALTLLLALEAPDATTPPLPPTVEQILIEGVRAFLRAYPTARVPESADAGSAR
jgi:TetR/AcrR family transcriptional repressor of mexJK operon